MQVMEVCVVQVHVDLHAGLAVWMEEFAPDIFDGKKHFHMCSLSLTQAHPSTHTGMFTQAYAHIHSPNAGKPTAGNP